MYPDAWLHGSAYKRVAQLKTPFYSPLPQSRNHTRSILAPQTSPMARLHCLVVATVLLLASAPALASDPEVCSEGYPTVYGLKGGQLPAGAKYVRAAAPKLAAAVSARAHKHEGCTVDSWTIEAACSKVGLRDGWSAWVG